MKYIRTEDGEIFKVWNWWNNSGSVPESDVKTIGCYVGKGKDISINDIVKQADNLEELIDGLIVEDKNNKDNWFIMETSEFMKMSIEERKHMGESWNFNAYIKTEKGLIYKAKMNEKGKLELL